MGTYWRIVVTVVALLGVSFLGACFSEGAAGVVGADIAVEQVNGGDGEFVAVQAFERAKQYPYLVVVLLSVGIILALWGNMIRKVVAGTMKKISIPVVIVSLLATLGCRRPYDTPEYVDVGTNETAYVVKIEGADKQVRIKKRDALHTAIRALPSSFFENFQGFFWIQFLYYR